MTTADDLIQNAFDSAIQTFRDQLKDEELYREILQITNIEQVYDATDKLQEDQARTGRLRHLSKIEPFLQGLRGYASVIEVFMQAKPDVLALIWGPIKLLLQWADVLKQSFDAIVDTAAEIGALLPEFKKATRLFEENPLIKEVLVLFFQDMLDFYLVALKFFKSPRLRFIFEALWPRHKDKIKVVVSHIRRHTILLRNEVRLENIQAEYDFRSQTMKHFEKAEDSHRRQEYFSIRTTITPQTYEETIERLNARRCNGTGDWLLGNETFLSWLNRTDNNTSTLWLKGIPGSGKTYLASMAVDESRKHGRILAAFLSYTISSSTSALSILHSLIFQLAADDAELQTIVCQYSSENFRNNFDAAQDVLSILLASAGPTYIIVDGLDEIEMVARCRLLKCLLQLSSEIEGMRMLLSCRSEADIANIIEGHCVELQVDNNNHPSIQVYIDQHTQKWFTERNFLPEARDEMRKLLAPLAYKARGMFLYAKVVLSSIEDLEVDEIQKDLNILPETLNDAYARILERIDKNTSHVAKDKARKIVGWISVSPTPLTIYELEQALVVSVQDENGSGRVTSTLSIVRLCGPIVEEINGYVEFVHFTVKEFFLCPSISGSIDPYDAHHTLAACCIKYLCQEHHNPELSGDEISQYVLSGAYRLHDYATTMWLKLTIECTPREKTTKLSEELAQLLDVMLTRRKNVLYDEDESPAEPTDLKSFGTKTVELQTLLRQASSFRANASTSSYDFRGSDYWTGLDPLTTSQMSHRIYGEFDTMLSDARNQDALKRHYGERLFKCGFFECPFRRHGFESRNLRNAHMNHHDRPWKCDFPECEFEEGGFLSRRMRDEHLDKFHRKNYALTFDPGQGLADEESNIILRDLVKSDDITSSRKLLASISVPRPVIIEELLFLGARYASPDMLAMLMSLHPNFRNRYKNSFWSGQGKMLTECISGGNTENLRYLLKNSKLLPDFKTACVGEALRHGNMEMIEMLDTWIKERFQTRDKLTFLVNCNTISGTEGDIYKEQILLNIWAQIPETFWKTRSWEPALPNVASTTCSMNLATYLIRKGIPVDTRLSEKHFTALAYASQKTTLAAAELMRYLLCCGAEPAIEVRVNKSWKISKKIGFHNMRIGEEKGAREISKWLGISWDELVAQDQEKRQTS